MLHMAKLYSNNTIPKIPTPTILFIIITDVIGIDVFYPLFYHIDDYPVDYIKLFSKASSPLLIINKEVVPKLISRNFIN